MIVYEVYGKVVDRGMQKHVIKADSADAAWERYCAAYKGLTCTRISIIPLLRRGYV